jgi:hypothetical protein
MRQFLAEWSLCAAIAVGITACGVKPIADGSAPGSDACLLLAASEAPPDTLLVASSGSTSLESDGEPVRSPGFGPLLYHARFRPLISVGCDGNPVPGISTSWARVAGGTGWRLTIDPDFRMADGSDAVAQRFVYLWAPSTGPGSSVKSLQAPASDLLDVELHASRDTLPAALASPRFALETSAFGQASETLPLGSILETDRPAPVLIEVDSASRDERDLLESGIDLMISSDPDVVAYANGLSAYETTPLPHDAVYALFVTTRLIEPERIDSAGARAAGWWPSFAGGAVRADAREPGGHPWWQRLEGCARGLFDSGVASRPTASFYASGRKRILYPTGDAVARDIAERVVALALTNAPDDPAATFLAASVPRLAESRGVLTARSVDASEFENSLQRGDDLAYVIRLPVRPYDVCRAYAAVVERAPWLAGHAERAATAIVPIVETRRHLIARTPHPALAFDWFGNIVFIDTPER